MEAPRPIFQDENGNAIKFFIQKDLPDDIQRRLQEDIVALGGRVHTKVPISGYVLTAPGTPEEQRLRYCWKQPDRPERFFVPHTYVDACKTSRKLIPQLFIEQGEPMQFHLHSSILNVNMREVISERIRHSGGVPDSPPETARVILADPGDESFKELIRKYEGDPAKYIEAFFWVQKCVEMGAIYYSPTAYKNPGGRKPGDERTNFTEEDERHLCEWLAFKIPYKEAGGRTGNKIYQQLFDLAEHDPQYAWVTRHTWQSWRERYKKHAHRLDRVIESIVEHKKPMLGEKGQYGYVRVDEPKEPKPTPKPRSKRKRARKDSTPEPSQNDGAYGGPVMLSPPNARMASRPPSGPTRAPSGPPRSQPAPAPPQPPPSQPGPAHHAATQPAPRAATQPAPRAAVQPPKRKATDIVDELDSESQWQIRIGDEPPPTWARPRDEDDDELAKEQSPTKRQRIREPSPSRRESEPRSPYKGERQSSRDSQKPASASLPPLENGEIKNDAFVADSQSAGDESQVLVPDSQASVNESQRIQESQGPTKESQVPFDESQRPLDESQKPFAGSQRPFGESQRAFDESQYSQSQPLADGVYLETQSDLVGAQPRDDSQYSWPSFPATQALGNGEQDSQGVGVESQASAINSQPAADSQSKFPAFESQPANDSQSSQPSTGTQSSTTILDNIHATERALRDIAKSFRFTYEEVKEYYDRCHDLARVRMRFQGMREVLRARFGD
ncbi:uncharacterized protein SCHCODRAFT_02696332 [Schizophyllum commune H4-8]|nr:uncharacterized protein SCHCODRAFT_02696332 [Schizophyllum commune H4-8]KAI5897677.1 hypothetical protein SCHCODRAFT_02696332 [Schizophyllum commune H4-8]